MSCGGCSRSRSSCGGCAGSARSMLGIVDTRGRLLTPYVVPPTTTPAGSGIGVEAPEASVRAYVAELKGPRGLGPRVDVGAAGQLDYAAGVTGDVFGSMFARLGAGLGAGVRAVGAGVGAGASSAAAPLLPLVGGVLLLLLLSRR